MARWRSDSVGEVSGPRRFTVGELERISELTWGLTTFDRGRFWDSDHVELRESWRRELEGLHEAADRRRTSLHSLWELSRVLDPEEAFYTEVTGEVYAPGSGHCFAAGEPWSSAAD
ncbi:hypothetical protein GCM10022261_20680 [Brevibacterium daeguense]|uniref:Uncharacterized protein n=1 Tax=Brevibacterium daeguense TaxID=909936 RepID=A0ABP8EKR8_9MICO